MSAAQLARNLDRIKRKFDVMHALGTDRILVCSNVSADTIADDGLLVDQLGALAEARGRPAWSPRTKRSRGPRREALRPCGNS